MAVMMVIERYGGDGLPRFANAPLASIWVKVIVSLLFRCWLFHSTVGRLRWRRLANRQESPGRRPLRIHAQDEPPPPPSSSPPPPATSPVLPPVLPVSPRLSSSARSDATLFRQHIPLHSDGLHWIGSAWIQLNGMA